MTREYTIGFSGADSPIRIENSIRKVWQNPSFSTYTLMGYMLNKNFPSPPGDPVSFPAPALARTATPYAVSVSDGRGGSASSLAYATVLPASNLGDHPLEVSLYRQRLVRKSCRRSCTLRFAYA